MIREHHAHDPEPAVGTVLQVGSPHGGDRVTFHRRAGGWTCAYGGSPATPCDYALVLFWAPARVVGEPSRKFVR